MGNENIYLIYHFQISLSKSVLTGKHLSSLYVTIKTLNDFMGVAGNQPNSPSYLELIDRLNIQIGGQQGKFTSLLIGFHSVFKWL
jgi:hypothetical protein